MVLVTVDVFKNRSIEFLGIHAGSKLGGGVLKGFALSVPIEMAVTTFCRVLVWLMISCLVASKKQV